MHPNCNALTNNTKDSSLREEQTCMELLSSWEQMEDGCHEKDRMDIKEGREEEETDEWGAIDGRDGWGTSFVD